MIALVDADIVCFRAAAVSEGEEESTALLRVDEMMDKILWNTRADSYLAFLSPKRNFRHYIYPLYKANRTQPKPIHLPACRDYLVTSWKASICEDIEADDALGIHQREGTIICSIDKDLRQIPGQHYNFVKNEWSDIDDYQADFNFYRQFLEGDRSDNIPGISGIGPKKAEKELYGLTNEEMFNRVRELYQDDVRMLMTGRCLKIMRKDGDIWNPSHLGVTLDFSEIQKQLREASS